jgi:hypothetical protein
VDYRHKSPSEQDIIQPSMYFPSQLAPNNRTLVALNASDEAEEQLSRDETKATIALEIAAGRPFRV